jgi:hypothetical protein
MKAIEELSTEELIALAKAGQAKDLAIEQERTEAAALIEKLKEQVAAKSDVKANQTSVKHEDIIYVFPTESWTEPNATLGEELVIQTAKEAIKDKALVVKLIERGFLKEKAVAKK